MTDYEATESYDEADWESAFEDLEYDESRRRRRRNRRQPRVQVPSGGGARPPTTPAALRREVAAGRRRDQQIARAVNETDADLNTLESRVNKANRDLGRLRMLSLIMLLLPRQLATQRLSVADVGSPPAPRLEFTTDPNRVAVDVATGSGQAVDILPLILFMTLGRDIGQPDRTGGGGSNDMMLPILLLALAPGLQGQTGQQAGGLNQNTLLLVLLASGGLS